MQLVWLVLALLAALQAGQAELLDSRQTSAHLVLRLIDCLASACDLYLLETRQQPPAAKALGPQEMEDRPEVEEVWPLAEQEEFPSTKPMDWRPAGGWEEAEDEAEEEEESGLSTSGCWRTAVEWLKAQLLAARMQLLLAADQNPLQQSLERMAQLNESLLDICPSNSDPRWEPTSLSYVRQSVQALAEICAQVRASLAAGSPAWSNGELVAAEEIEARQAYLEQIVVSYKLIFAASQPADSIQ